MPSGRPPIITVPEISRSRIIAAAIALVALWLLSSCWYTVPSESVGVVQRFGRCLDDLKKPGLHFKAPFGIDVVQMAPILRQLKMEFGFTTPGWTNPAQPSRDSDLEESMVTGDLNAVLVQWVVQYRVTDPKLYLFHVANPEDTLRDLSEAAMREVIGDRTVDEVITIGRQEIEGEVAKRLGSLAKLYELGVIIDQVQLKDVDPPVPVQASFDEVNKAQQDRESAINVANGEYNKAVPRARGTADQKIQAAEGAKLKRINESQGDVASFKSQFEQYTKAPDVTRARLYLESLAEVLPQAGPKMIVDQSVKQILPMLPAATTSVSRPAAAAAGSLEPATTTTTSRTRR